MGVPKLSASVIITCVIFALLGVVWGAHSAGIIDIKKVLTDLPIIGQKFASETEKNENKIIAPLEEENSELKEKISLLEKQISDNNSEKSQIEEQLNNLKNEKADLQKRIDELINKEEQTIKLAEFYSEMKAKDIVPIFDNLDDDIVLEILKKVESSQSAKILTEMDPIRAAKLTRVLTDSYKEGK